MHVSELVQLRYHLSLLIIRRCQLVVVERNVSMLVRLEALHDVHHISTCTSKFELNLVKNQLVHGCWTVSDNSFSNLEIMKAPKNGLATGPRIFLWIYARNMGWHW